MKIAVFSSAQGEKIIHVHEFFKEGNRIAIDSLVTDNPEAPITGRMKDEGIDVIYLLPDGSPTRLAEELKLRGVELLVVDDFAGELPDSLQREYKNAIVYPSSVNSAPLDIINAGKRADAAAAPIISEKASVSTGSENQEAKEDISPLDKEWADALEIDIKVEETEETEGPKENTRQPPLYTEAPTGGFTPPPSPQPSFTNREYQAPTEPMPDTYLIWSVIITILCCLIFGVIAIVYSASVSSKYYAGDIEGARRASRNAQIWCIVSVVAGIVWATLYVPLAMLL